MKLPNKLLTAICCLAVALQGAAFIPAGYAQGQEGAAEPLSAEAADVSAEKPDGELSPPNTAPDASTAIEAAAVQEEIAELAAFSNQNTLLEESFNEYAPGSGVLGLAGLNSANAATGFAGGWTPWVTSETQESEDKEKFVIGSGQIGGEQTVVVPRAKKGGGHAVGMYRKMAAPVELESDSEYYVRFSFIMPEKALFNQNRSMKLELLTEDKTPLLTFGVITADGTSRNFYPFIKAGAVTSGSGFAAHRGDVVRAVARVRTTPAGKSELSLKCCLQGEAEPADWNINKLNFSNKQAMTFIGMGTNSISDTDSGAEFGPMAVERYQGSELSCIAAAEDAVRALRASVSEKDIPAAEELVSRVPEGMAKQSLAAGLESVRTVIEEQKAIIQAADEILSRWENTDLNETNYLEAEAAAAGLLPELEKLLNREVYAAYQVRIAALENEIAVVRIKVNRAEDTFSYPAGTRLSDTTAEGAFSSGWKADAALETPLEESYFMGADGKLTLAGNMAMYRGLQYPVRLDQETSSFLRLQFSFSGVEQFAGIALGGLRFGVTKENGRVLPVIISGDKTFKGTVSLQENTVYNVVVRLDGSAVPDAERKLSLAVYPDGEDVTEWQISGTAEDEKAFQTVGIEADGSITILGLSKDEAGSAYLNGFDQAVQAVLSQNTLPGIVRAEEQLGTMVDCIAKEILSAQIRHARTVNENTPPVVDYVTVSGSPRTGQLLTGTYGLIDRMENADSPVLEWKSGGKVIAAGSTWQVSAAYAGKTVSFAVTAKNLAGLTGGTKEYEIRIADSSSGGGGGSGGRPGGGSSGGGGYAAGGTAAEPSADPGKTDTDFEKAPEPYIFVDMIGHWAKEAVSELADLGIVKGASKDFFEPDATVTRAEFAAMLSRVLKNTQAAGSFSFRDVEQSQWYWEAVQNVASLGIMVGDETGRFEPDRQISREEIAKAVSLAYGIYGGNTERGTASVFSDADEISVWAVPYVEDCAALRLMNGLPDGSFAPARSATRAEAAVVIKHVLNSK